MISTKLKSLNKDHLAHKLREKHPGLFSKNIMVDEPYYSYNTNLITNKERCFSVKFKSIKYNKFPIWLLYKDGVAKISTVADWNPWYFPPDAGKEYNPEYGLSIEDILSSNFKNKKLRQFVLYNLDLFKTKKSE